MQVFIYSSDYLYYDYRPLFVCIKDRNRIAIPAYCFNICGSIFVFLFCLFIRRLILRIKTIWQSMRKFPCVVWSVGTFPHMDKDETSFFLKKAPSQGLNIFSDNYLFMRSENLKTSLKIQPQIFLRRKILTFAVFKWCKYPLTLNYPLQYAKRLSNIIVR